uniref:Uncharacterized protein n=1 Tax=viral metagenome TaxID=1070528 RepID=A0A6M3LME2_9ZZZZ
MYKCIECGKSWLPEELLSGRCPHCKSDDVVELQPRVTTHHEAYTNRIFRDMQAN